MNWVIVDRPAASLVTRTTTEVLPGSWLYPAKPRVAAWQYRASWLCDGHGVELIARLVTLGQVDTGSSRDYPQAYTAEDLAVAEECRGDLYCEDCFDLCIVHDWPVAWSRLD